MHLGCRLPIPVTTKRTCGLAAAVWRERHRRQRGRSYRRYRRRANQGLRETWRSAHRPCTCRGPRRDGQTRRWRERWHRCTSDQANEGGHVPKFLLSTQIRFSFGGTVVTRSASHGDMVIKCSSDGGGPGGDSGARAGGEYRFPVQDKVMKVPSSACACVGGTTDLDTS